MTNQPKADIDGDSAIRKRLFKNSGLIMGCRVVTASTSLLAVPFMVSKLGIDGYGTWEAIMAISMICSIFQQSVIGTLLWKVSQAHGVSDHVTIKRMMRLGATAIILIAILITPIVWNLSTGLAHFFHVPKRFVPESITVIPFVVGATILFGLNDVMGTSISGSQRTGTVTIIQAISLVVNYLTAITCILQGFGLKGLMIGMMTGAIVSSFFYAYQSNKICHGLSLIPALPTLEELSQMIRYAGLLFIGFSSTALRDQTDKLVLARYATQTWVGNDGIAGRLAALVMETARFFYFPLLTAVGAMHAADNWEGVQRIYANMITLVGLIAGSVTIIVAGLHERVVMLWMGKPYPQTGIMILILLTGNAFAVILTGPGTAICRAIGKVWVETSYVIINLVGNILLTIALVSWLGPIGTVIASGSTWAVSAVAFTYFLGRVVDLPQAATSNARRFMALVVACSALTYYVSSVLPPSHNRLQALGSLAILGFLSTTIYVGLAMLTGLVPKGSLRKLVRRQTGA